MSNPRFPAVVDDVTVRLVAGVVLVLTATALLLQQWWILLPLAVDFVLRATLGPRVSPLARFVGRWVRPRLAAVPYPTAGTPKRFAAAIGAVLTSVAVLLWLVHLTTGSGAALMAVGGLTVVMVVFPALEAVLGLCVGCRLFAVLMRVGLVPEDVCVECADITGRLRGSSVPAR